MIFLSKAPAEGAAAEALRTDTLYRMGHGGRSFSSPAASRGCVSIRMPAGDRKFASATEANAEVSASWCDHSGFIGSPRTRPNRASFILSETHIKLLIWIVL